MERRRLMSIEELEAEDAANRERSVARDEGVVVESEVGADRTIHPAPRPGRDR